MRDIEKRLLRLEARLGVRARRIVSIPCNHGEDSTLVVADWESKHPGEECVAYILRSIYAEPPREGFATRDSILRVLPGVKEWAEQSGQVDEESWRAWATAAGIDYDAICPEGPAQQHPASRHD